MNEEQIINSVKPIVNARKTHKDNHLYSLQLNAYQLDAIQGLLDLYNEEKQKREIAEENDKVLSLDLGDALKELGLPEDTIIADELVLEINNRYISKDKIRELIKKEAYTDTYNFKTIKVSKLEELLEERFRRVWA